MLIEGKEKVVKHLLKMIQVAEGNLFEFIRGIEKVFATRILAQLFDIIPRLVNRCRTEQERQALLEELHDCVMLLDSLIENDMLNPYLKEKGGPPIVRNPHSENHANIAYFTFRTQISEPRTVLLQCRTSDTYRIHMDFGSAVRC